MGVESRCGIVREATRGRVRRRPRTRQEEPRPSASPEAQDRLPEAAPDEAADPRRDRTRAYVRPTVAEINTAALHGRTDLAVGDRVRIAGTGLYSGEIATIEKFAGQAIPTAVVRTEAGRTRQVRTIDLEPIID